MAGLDRDGSGQPGHACRVHVVSRAMAAEEIPRAQAGENGRWPYAEGEIRRDQLKNKLRGFKVKSAVLFHGKKEDLHSI